MSGMEGLFITCQANPYLLAEIDGGFALEPTFTRQDLKDAIPDRCFRPDTARSFAYLFFDIALIALCYWALSSGYRLKS